MVVPDSDLLAEWQVCAGSGCFVWRFVLQLTGCLVSTSAPLTAGLSSKREQHLLDLYTGTGTIALSLAPQCKAVTGVESVRSAVADARANGKRNAIHHAHFVQADLSSADELQRIASVNPDVVVAGVQLGISVL